MEMCQTNVRQRNWSLDLVRIISMLMIIILHLCNHGGLLNAYPTSSINYWGIHTLYYLSVSAVNIFVLISGYFLIYKMFSLKRIITNITQVWFYSWIIQSILIIIKKVIGTDGYTLREILTSYFPISLKQYWFASVYIGLLLLMPLMNCYLLSLRQKEYKRIVIYLFFILSVWATLIPSSDIFNLEKGYGIAWFCFLYVYAGYCKLHGQLIKRLTRSHYIIIYLLCVAAMIIVKIAVIYFNNKISFLKEIDLNNFFYRYCSIPCFIAGASFFNIFKDIEIKKQIFIQVIKATTPLIFGVYLIHDNVHIREILYYSILKTDRINDTWYTLFLVMAMAIAILIVCLLIEYGRKLLFRLWESNINFSRCIDKVQNKLYLMINHLK